MNPPPLVSQYSPFFSLLTLASLVLAQAKTTSLVSLVASTRTAHDVTTATIVHFPFPLKHREYVSRAVAAEDSNGDLLYASAPSAPDVIDYGDLPTFDTVRGESRTFVRISPVSPSQCTVTFHQYATAGGWIPPRLSPRLESRLASRLPAARLIFDMRQEFQRDREVDRMARLKRASVMHEPQT